MSRKNRMMTNKEADLAFANASLKIRIRNLEKELRAVKLVDVVVIALLVASLVICLPSLGA